MRIMIVNIMKCKCCGEKSNFAGTASSNQEAMRIASRMIEDNIRLEHCEKCGHEAIKEFVGYYTKEL